MLLITNNQSVLGFQRNRIMLSFCSCVWRKSSNHRKCILQKQSCKSPRKCSHYAFAALWWTVEWCDHRVPQTGIFCLSKWLTLENHLDWWTLSSVSYKTYRSSRNLFSLVSTLNLKCLWSEKIKICDWKVFNRRWAQNSFKSSWIKFKMLIEKNKMFKSAIVIVLMCLCRRYRAETSRAEPGAIIFAMSSALPR